MSNISALSYFIIPHNVPGAELWHYFYNKEFPLPLLNLDRPYVFAIKKYSNTTEFEIYFYRYQLNRSFHHVILDPSINYQSVCNIHALYNKITLPTNYIITSLDIDAKYKLQEDHINFYYQLPDCYTCEEHNIKTNSFTLQNIYNVDYKILPNEPHHNEYINKYKDNDTIVFICNKIQKNYNSYYFENVKFNIFLTFLEDFNYSLDFIFFCKKHYNDKYRFCFSYDIDCYGHYVKSTLFSVYHIHAEHY